MSSVDVSKELYEKYNEYICGQFAIAPSWNKDRYLLEFNEGNTDQLPIEAFFFWRHAKILGKN
jgi:hypothetical protein